MSCVMRAASATFDVDAFLDTTDFVPCHVWHVGEIRPISKSPSETSGFNLPVSDDDLDAFDTHITQTIKFLRECREDLQRLAAIVGDSGIELDLGVAIRAEMPMKTCRLPPELIQLAAEFRMEIALSYYKCE